MTDYKNELEQFDHLWAMGATYEEMKAFVEALLSQHSKKRELEAYKKGYIDGGIKEITK